LCEAGRSVAGMMDIMISSLRYLILRQALHLLLVMRSE
jgi:hypothetical protein